MREPTADEAYKLKQLQAARNAAAKNLGVVAGAQGKGSEAKFLEAVEAEYAFRRTVLGEVGLM